MAHINYNKITKEEMELIYLIAKRANKGITGETIDITTMEMDLSATHSKNPLALKEFLNADDSNFWHDIYGIRRHLNRDTLEMEDCFSPRFDACYHK